MQFLKNAYEYEFYKLRYNYYGLWIILLKYLINNGRFNINDFIKCIAFRSGLWFNAPYISFQWVFDFSLNINTKIVKKYKKLITNIEEVLRVIHDASNVKSIK